MKAAKMAPFVALALVISSHRTSADVTVTGTCYNLPPNTSPIKGPRRDSTLPESVKVSVQRADPVDPRRRGAPVAVRTQTFNAETGAYSFTIDLGNNAGPTMVFIDFVRNEAPRSTRTLEGVVLVNNQPYHVDTTVPEFEGECAPNPDCYLCRTPVYKKRLFGRFR